MNKQYIELRNGGYYIVQTRISLDSVVYQFLNGESPEGILQLFPLLTLEQIYGAITFYLGHKNEIDIYLKKQEEAFEMKRQASLDADPAFYQQIGEFENTLQTTK